MEFKYDIALSFAGEDRDYVERVANIIKERGVKVFYDKFEKVDLWGKDLAIHFDYVYRKSARYCIPFISRHYKEKIWTRHEIRTAISRAITENREYILPARFDDTELDGIRPTIGMLDLRLLSPEGLAQIILEKLEKEPSVPITEKEQPDGNIYLSLKAHAIPPGVVIGFFLSVDATNTVRENRYFNQPIFELSKPIHGDADTFQLTNMVEKMKFPRKLEFGETLQVMYQLPMEFIDSLKTLRGKAVTLVAVVSTTVGEKFRSNEYKIDDLISWIEKYGR